MKGCHPVIVNINAGVNPDIITNKANTLMTFLIFITCKLSLISCTKCSTRK